MEDRDPADIAWEALSFLASPADEQVRLLGPAEEWFIREDPRFNVGANYIRGVANVFLEYANAFMDSAELLDVGTLTALRDKIWDIPDRAWSIKGLTTNQDWDVVRRIATTLLNEAQLERSPPIKPFWIPDLLEVDRYVICDPGNEQGS